MAITQAPDATARPAVAPATGNKKKFVLPIVGLLILLGIVWGVKNWSYGRAHQSTDNAQVDGHIVPVLAKVGGYVTSVSVDENQLVKEGQVIARIDSAEYAVRLAQAEADYQAAQATAGGSGEGIGQAQAQVQSAASQRSVVEAGIAVARANNERAQADLGRFRDLAEKQIVSRQQLDAAQATADVAAANLVAAQRQSAAAGATVTNFQAGVRLAEARLAAAKAARDNAKLQLSYTTITAPASGMVSKKQLEVGQLVQPGQQLLNVVPDTAVWVTANFKETQLQKIHVGQAVEIEVDAYNGCKAEGKVSSLSAATGARFALLPPDNATGNFTKVVQRVPVRIDVTKGCGANQSLRPGMSVNAHVETK